MAEQISAKTVRKNSAAPHHCPSPSPLQLSYKYLQPGRMTRKRALPAGTGKFMEAGYRLPMLVDTMMSRFPGILLVMLMFVLAAAVLATGCTSPSAGGQATSAPAATQAPPPVTVASAVTLGKMHGTMMEAIEEALAYPVLKNTEEKADFAAKSAEFDVLAVQFASEAALDQPANAGTKKAFDAILVKKAKLVETANGFFAVYEKDMVVPKAEVTALENSVDDFTGAFGPFTQDYFDRVSITETGTADHARAALALLTMHHDILEGVEEAFGYVLLNDTMERDDFWMKMQEFDNAAAAFNQSAYLDRPGNSLKLIAFDSMVQAKQEMQTAAATMFIQYENTGTVSAGVAEAFESKVDLLTAEYDNLLAEVLREL